MNKTHYFHVLCIFFAFVILCSCQSNSTDVAKDPNLNYSDLVNLFKEWRTFEKPPILDGAPNYTAKSFNDRVSPFKELQFKLSQFDTTGWPISHKVDWHIIQAEMNGFDFNHRILQPWVRDPAFYKSVWTYKSDVPAHEGPTHHATTEIWQYNFPLSEKEKNRLIADLKVIPPLNEQAKENLKGNARDLWITGINDIEQQSKDLAAILSRPGVSTDTLLAVSIAKAITSTDSFVDWLKEESVNKNGPSGIGKENYSWYLQNVHLVPLSWEDEVMLLKRELARAWSSLKMEEHRNRNLPPLVAANSEETYNKMAEKAANSLLTFLDEQEIVTVADYFEPALQPHLGEFLPEDKRNFFTITEHYDPRPLYSHFYHWFELARMEESPNTSEIRRGPLLYNIFDSRNEGMATAVEELFMQAGLYDDSPRVREIVYIMIAQRAARGLGSLYAHANEMSFEEAGAIHSEYTPRGWMKTEKELLIFEQQLYLRQPGYGTSYISGKYLIENAMADFARIKELNAEDFKVKDFFDSMNSIGNIPVSLAKWELTGSKN